MQTSAYDQANAPQPGHTSALHEGINQLIEHLQSEAMLAVELVEQAVLALRNCDHDIAVEVRRRDTEVDAQEVLIEEQCIRLIALHQPVARDLRALMIVIRANSDIERIADHASGVAKAVAFLGNEPSPNWPTSLIELAERIIPLCHDTVRALGQRDEKAARRIIAGDEALDRLTDEVVKEIESSIGAAGLSRRAGLLAYRACRDLERIGDLCVNICEDILYVQHGKIIRHEKKLAARNKS